MKTCFLVVTCIALLGVSGCSQRKPTTTSSTSSSLVAIPGAKYLLAAEPEGAADVIKVREDGKDQGDVVIVGRIGGSGNPWIDGMAAFTIVDPSLKHCHELTDDGCLQPWDFC